MREIERMRMLDEANVQWAVGELGGRVSKFEVGIKTPAEKGARVIVL